MPQRAQGLTAQKVLKGREAGRYGDGGGLYLLVRATTRKDGTPGPEAKFWLFRYTRAGKMREMGLGAASGKAAVSLADARKKAGALRDLVRDGRDPIEERAAAEARAKAEAVQTAAAAVTFRDAMERCIASLDAGWRNRKHAKQWRATLKAYVLPAIGKLPVGSIGDGDVTAILEPLWARKPETASRVRGRIERILDYAKVRGWRTGENPARWRGHLENILPARSKVARVEHHAALPYSELGDFMTALRQQGGVAARALEFTILTAARTGEAIGARWSEIDLAAKIWTVSAERMKAGKEHRVPLAPRAVAILGELAELRSAESEGETDHFVFPGTRAGRSLSGMAMLMLLRRMNRGDITVHGFRSTFRDWAAERTNFANHVVEAALAHTIGNAVEAAYRRGDLFDKRRRLAGAWATFCGAPSTVSGRDATVTKLRG
jgi:integrase